ncbi:hypothetical protein [Microseira wollei]|nr:hypothetical protein [Microseira wollei]
MSRLFIGDLEAKKIMTKNGLYRLKRSALNTRETGSVLLRDD